MLGGSCSPCCDNCNVADIPQSIELDITGTGSGLYAAATYRDRAFIPFFGNIGPVITVASGYYARAMQSGTYSLAFQSLIEGNTKAIYSYSDNVFSVSCAVGLNENALLLGPGVDAAFRGAGVLLEFRVVNTIAVSFVTGEADAVLQIKTESEMEDVLDDLIEFGETAQTNFLSSATRPQQKEFFFNPVMQAKYRCLGTRDSALVSTFMNQLSGNVIHFSTPNTLFPFAFTQANGLTIRSVTAGAFVLTQSSWIYVEYGSFTGDWQVTSAPFDGSTFYTASLNVTRRMDVTECRAVFADGSTKRLPFG